MREYNCPDCQSTDCTGCHRTLFRETNLPNIPIVDPFLRTAISTADYIPPACRGCANHPSNGGSGICHCILGNQQVYY